MKFEKFTVTLSLSVEQVNQLAGLTRLYNDRMVSEGYNGGYTELSYLELLLSFGLGGLLSDTLDRERNLKNKRDLKDSAHNPSSDEAAPDEAEPETVSNSDEAAPGDVPTRNPSPDKAAPDEPEPGTVSNAEESASGDKETRLSVRLADGSLTTMTLDEIDEHREAARNESEAPESDEEDFLSLTPLPCSYPHDPTVQDTPYDPARYEGDAYECGGCVVENPETLAFVDALTEALCR